MIIIENDKRPGLCFEPGVVVAADVHELTNRCIARRMEGGSTRQAAIQDLLREANAAEPGAVANALRLYLKSLIA